MPITTGAIPKAIQPSGKKKRGSIDTFANPDTPKLGTLRDAVIVTKPPKMKGGKK